MAPTQLTLLGLLLLLPLPSAVRLQQLRAGGGVEQELSTLHDAVEAARSSAAEYPSDVKGLPVTMNHNLLESRTKAFPSTVCVPRRALMAEIPEDLGPGAFRTPLAEPEPSACSPVMSDSKVSTFLYFARAEEAPVVCAFDHAVLGEEGNLCLASGCLLNQAWEPKQGLPDQTAVFFSRPKFKQGDQVNPGMSCSPEGGCQGDLSKLPEYDVVYTIAQDRGWQFGHFMMGSLYRLLVGLDFLRGSGKEAVIHASSAHDWALDALVTLGIAPQRVVLGDLRAKALLYPEDTTMNRAGHKLVALSRWMLRQYVPTGIPPTWHRRSPVILVLKQEPIFGRVMTNYDELVSQLNETFAGQGLSVRTFDAQDTRRRAETWQLFASSAVVVGVHGEALANIAIMSPGSAVVEVMAGGKREPCGTNTFQMTCARLGVQHYAVHEPALSADTPSFSSNISAVVRAVSRAVLAAELDPSMAPVK